MNPRLVAEHPVNQDRAYWQAMHLYLNECTVKAGLEPLEVPEFNAVRDTAFPVHYSINAFQRKAYDTYSSHSKAICEELGIRQNKTTVANLWRDVVLMKSADQLVDDPSVRLHTNIRIEQHILNKAGCVDRAGFIRKMNVPDHQRAALNHSMPANFEHGNLEIQINKMPFVLSGSVVQVSNTQYPDAVPTIYTNKSLSPHVAVALVKLGMKNRIKPEDFCSWLQYEIRQAIAPAGRQY